MMAASIMAIRLFGCRSPGTKIVQFRTQRCFCIPVTQRSPPSSSMVRKEYWFNKERYEKRSALSISRSYTTSSVITKGSASHIPNDPVLTSFSYNGKEFSYNATWLRENCPCDQCYNHGTAQRNVLYHMLTPQQIRGEVVATNSECLSIAWQDGHQSQYNIKWLQDNYHTAASKKTAASAGKTGRSLWDASTMRQMDLDRIPYPDLMMTDDKTALKRVLTSLLKYGFALVSGCPVSIEGTREVAESICFIQETVFGSGMWSFTSDLSRADTAYSTLPLGAHTDTSYFTAPTGIQIFHCLYHDGGGGETLLVDGFKAAETLRCRDPESFNLLQRSRIYHCYREGERYHSRSLGPILTTDPVSGEMEMIRYNHYDREAISTIPADDLPAYYSALGKLSLSISDPSSEFWLKLTPGTVILIDNWRVMHGRAGFKGTRKMGGCYLPRDDWMGKARTLGLVQ